MKTPQSIERRDWLAASAEIEALPAQHAAGAGTEEKAEKKQGKLIHAVVADHGRICNLYHDEYPKRVTILHEFAALAMRVRNSYLPGDGSAGRLPGIHLARSVVPADLLNRKWLIAGAAFHLLYLRPIEPDEVTHRDVRCVASQGIGLHIALILNLETIWATEDTALHSVMTMMNMNKDDRANHHHDANSDCGSGDLGSGRTEA